MRYLDHLLSADNAGNKESRHDAAFDRERGDRLPTHVPLSTRSFANAASRALFHVTAAIATITPFSRLA